MNNPAPRSKHRPRARLLPLPVDGRPIPLQLLEVRIPRHPPGLPPPRAALDGPAGPDPLPRAADLAVVPLALPRAHVGVLLHHRPDALPDPLPLGQGVHAPEDVVPQVRQEQERVVLASFLVGKLLLRRQAAQHEVNEGRDLGRGGAV